MTIWIVNIFDGSCDHISLSLFGDVVVLVPLDGLLFRLEGFWNVEDIALVIYLRGDRVRERRLPFFFGPTRGVGEDAKDLELAWSWPATTWVVVAAAIIVAAAVAESGTNSVHPLSSTAREIIVNGILFKSGSWFDALIFTLSLIVPSRLT